MLHSTTADDVEAELPTEAELTHPRTTAPSTASERARVPGAPAVLQGH